MAKFEYSFGIECQCITRVSEVNVFGGGGKAENNKKNRKIVRNWERENMKNWERITYREMANSDDNIHNDNEYQLEMDDLTHDISSE